MDLMVTLAIVAGVVLLAVVVHGAWTTRRSGPRLPQPPDSADPGRLEPTLGGLDPMAGGAADPEVGLPEPARPTPTVAARWPGGRMAPRHPPRRPHQEEP